ncbi:hypothetical protein J25TS5_20770 [Paenibacillus faecis]|nr:hypothetical protein J25TS5_20770 [Paenibacillus faecis]
MRSFINSGAKLIHLDTHDFQAPDFYLKQGYEVFGLLEDIPLRCQPLLDLFADFSGSEGNGGWYPLLLLPPIE